VNSVGYKCALEGAAGTRGHCDGTKEASRLTNSKNRFVSRELKAGQNYCIKKENEVCESTVMFGYLGTTRTNEN